MVDTALRSVNYDDLMALGSDVRVEVVNGEIREMSPTGRAHNILGGNIYDAFKVCAKRDKSGLAATDGLIFLMGQHTANLRDSFVPDVSYTTKESIPKDWPPEAPLPGVPTLAVEIMSPNDDPDALLTKINRYLELGTEEVWALYPHARQLNQHRRDTPTIIRVYRDPAERIETPLLPGLDLTLAQIFEMPDWANEAKPGE